MASARRIALAVTIAVVVLVAAAVLACRWADRQLNYVPRQLLSQANPGWMDAFRTVYRVPQVASLSLPRTADGDGSASFYAAAMTWRPGRAPKGPPAAADSALWRAAAADTNLDRIVAAARQRGWDAVANALPNGDSTGFYHFRTPPFTSIVIALQGLRIRAEQRLARRDLTGARTDLAALTSLGDQMCRHEPTLTGLTAGQRALRLALTSYTAVAGALRDTSAAAQLRALRKWADFQPVLGTNPILYLAAPDSAYAMARDSTMALGWRQFSLYAFVAAHLERSKAVLFGIPRTVRDSVAALSRAPNGDLARLVGVALYAIDRYEASSVLQRWRSVRASSQLMPL